MTFRSLCCLDLSSNTLRPSLHSRHWPITALSQDLAPLASIDLSGQRFACLQLFSHHPLPVH